MTSERELGGRGRGEREENIDLLFHLFMYSLFDFCMCPDHGSNPQTWCIKMML